MYSRALEHWESLALALDVTFREDACRARKDYSATNLNTLRKFALAIVSQYKDKLSLRKRLFKAAQDLMRLPCPDMVLDLSRYYFNFEVDLCFLAFSQGGNTVYFFINQIDYLLLYLLVVGINGCFEAVLSRLIRKLCNHRERFITAR